ncbi:TetR/AcrR family transcriptional regulator [Mesorhizobium sp. CU2]|uniref:TetR/AcrR family transcriptional regulator n=1 Tax=unclassified Mesorhizobium TaxID=325217 RepID=UPI00112CEECE|nr:MULTISPECIES: TetR/AcrR family transcriptional regulator [unclassified Mesorhizobium]TPN81124.1 TetR/AcrR family transcriptional regulator [Mesorhizobium sp. CU3]TPO17078.1 TetR/AcrR family transcriptional regulator [Mesorhizobium sp. CU2]
MRHSNEDRVFDTAKSAVVRPKSSQRKSRSDDVEHIARRPIQNRSQARFSKILTTAEKLLETANIEDISSYDIARAANIPPASISYLFPTMAALRIELTRKCAHIATEITVRAHRAQAQSKNPSWQVWMYKMGEYARDQYNSNRPACEVLLGPQLHRQATCATFQETRAAARELVSALRSFFVIPDIPDMEETFSRAMDLVEGVWARAYLLYGRIDDESFEHSMRMQISYLRTILPDVLAVKRGKRGA